MWIEIPCWVDLRHSLGSCFFSLLPGAPRSGILLPPAGSLISFRSPVIHVHPPPNGF